MTPADILVAVPTRGAINANLVTRLFELQREYPDLLPPLLQLGHLSVSNGRNAIVRRFLATPCSVLLMIDDDVEPPPQVLELADSDADITGIPYLYYHGTLNIPAPAVFKIYDNKLRVLESPFGRTGRVEVDAMGTGVIAIKRRVFEHPDMRAPFAIKYDDDGVMIQTDDIAFCNRAREAGFRQVMDFSLGQADHYPAQMSLNKLQAGYTDAYLRAHAKKGSLVVV